MSGPVLHVEIARKAFGARVVLADLRFDLAPGEILAVGGPSGCGKSTLLRLVAGLDRDYAGRIVAPPRIAMAFQEPRLLPWRSARDNLVLAGADPGTAGTLLGELGLADAADVPADRLSLGMARRVALARALAVPADLLLLDEPFASLDEAAAARARMLLLSAWRARPCAAVMVTHDLGEATALADRIMLLEGDPARVGREILVPAESRRPAARYFKVSR